MGFQPYSLGFSPVSQSLSAGMKASAMVDVSTFSPSGCLMPLSTRLPISSYVSYPFLFCESSVWPANRLLSSVSFFYSEPCEYLIHQEPNESSNMRSASVCAASIARLVVVYTVTVNDENDSSLLLWSTIEINVGIICACLPSLRHPVTQFSPRIFAHKRKTSDGSEVRSHTSINVEIKHSRSNSQSMGYRRGSLTSEVSYPRNSNVIDFSYFGSEDLEDSRDRDPDHENEISTVSSNLPTPDTPTSLLFDIESQNPFDSLTGTPHHASPASDKNKPLPLPPSPVLPSPVLIMPAPVSRPAGPRSLQSSSKVFTMRSHKVRYEPRTILPLACIPESQSPITSPRRGSPQIGRRDGSTGLCKSSPPPDSDHDEDRNYSHERARRTTAPPVPPYYDPNAGGGNTSTSYGNIAPWDACPCPGSKTYSYEILGGPRALGKDATRSLSWRQRARRDKERAQWAKRNEQQRKERESRNRPNGPRELD